ncbi:hypothetical protein BYT27DRAFT_7242120 [Phlegmacium glaucopus]|nr:hypothetical protein BYT27DRAFT_7242120 [Phlegmacium glaucopus]
MLQRPDLCGSDLEVIPDSEDERLRQEAAEKRREHTSNFTEVIEISSDEESPSTLIKDQQWSPRLPASSLRIADKQPYRPQMIRSPDNDSDDEIIELTDSSVELTPAKVKQRAPASLDGDESIIVFDEPKSAKTPLRVGTKDTSKKTPSKSGNSSEMVNNGQKLSYRNSPSTSAVALVPLRVGPPPASSLKTPRSTSKKAQQTVEQRRRHDYAQQLFEDLNASVFKGGLPHNTALDWNKRLLTTAGRAKWHRAKDGIETTQIELAEKILDRDERIRNTLSHEMCHLATWIIDKEINEHHGQNFKKWASRVMQRRPEINVSIKHDYQISYPYEWECQKCAKVYGRFSKSIRPDECVCGACKEGNLVPLFTSKRQPKSQKLSRMVAAKTQDSPRSMVRPAHVIPVGNVSTTSGYSSCDGSESDSDIETLTNELATTSIM